MDKENRPDDKLVEMMRKAYFPHQHILGAMPRFVFDLCALAAQSFYGDRWVKASEGLPETELCNKKKYK